MNKYKWITYNDNTNRHPGILSNVIIFDCRNMKLSILEKIKYGILK
jgi:hypothetical protein